MRTSSCVSTVPRLAISATTGVPRMGMTTSFLMTRETAVPRGRCAICLYMEGRRTRALPRQMRPTGLSCSDLKRNKHSGAFLILQCIFMSMAIPAYTLKCLVG